MLKGMKAFFRLGLIGLCFAPLAWGQNYDALGNYQGDYQGADSGLGAPGGLTGLGLGQPSEFSSSTLPPNAPSTEDLQGCGTVGVDDYTGQLYNNATVFDKFSKQDVNSELAKQLLTYNYSMPQTAALFAQLNQFGNDRYRQFQQGCALSSQQTEARRLYVQECVKTVQPAIVEASLQPTTVASNATPPTPEELQARKVARAYELCTQQYNSTTRSLLKQKSQSYAETVRQAQDVNRMLRPLLCPEARPLGNGNSPQAAACWPNLFLPQVRLMAEGVTSSSPETDFGVKAAPISMSDFLDALRITVGDTFQNQVLNPFRESVSNLGQATLNQAALIAVQSLGNVAATADNRLRPYRVDYLNCKNADITLALKEYGQALTQIGVKQPQGPTLSGTPLGFDPPASFGPAQTEPIAKRLLANSKDEAIRADQTDLASLLDIAAGCATNQQVPFLDPQILARLNSCQPDDKNAYFAMASYDVAVVATRNVLTYTRDQLQTALGRLSAGDQTSLLALKTDNIPDSPVIREKLATAVRTIMLPHLEQQLARLQQFEATRGAFGQRVSAIYQKKASCLSSN